MSASAPGSRRGSTSQAGPRFDNLGSSAQISVDAQGEVASKAAQHHHGDDHATRRARPIHAFQRPAAPRTRPRAKNSMESFDSHSDRIDYEPRSSAGS